jgi:uncharacterized surface protein with fasciclin (FAS1) repeats
MKVKTNALRLLGAALMVSLISTQAHAFYFFKGGWHKEKVSITDTVSKSGGEFDRKRSDYDILLNAVLIAGLDEALADPYADLTVFAPTDLAFIRLARDLGYHGYSEEGAFDTIVETLTVLGNGDPVPLLTDILLYHVSPGEQKAKNLLRSASIPTLLEGSTILPSFNRLVDNDPEFKNPKLSFWSRGTKASNGVIYRIGRVLIPADLPALGQEELPTITGTVLASGGDFDNNPHDFDLLLNAVLAANLAGALDDSDSTLTVFAPNDAAFIKLANDLGYQGSDEAGAFSAIATALTDLGGGELVPILTNVLLYHVAPEALTVKDLIDADSINTLLEGASFSPNGLSLVDNAPALTDPRLRTRSSNILTSNGRIHTIDRVLIPVAIP